MHVLRIEVIQFCTMAVGKLFVVCGIIAGILAWLATRLDIFTVKNEMFVAREASEVYKLIADLRRHTKYHSYVPKEIELLHTKISDDGFEERVFNIKEYVPLPFGYQIPVTFDALAKLTKPNEELVIEITVIGLGTKGTSTWTLLPGTHSGTLITEEFTLQCQWVTCGFVEDKARVSHEELFRHLKEDLESTDFVL